MPFERLTEGQRACLRLVRLHMSSKEIARELGISSHTVDRRLKNALAILGVASRHEAALLFERHAAEPVYQPLAYQTPAVAEPPDHRPSSAPDTGVRRQPDDRVQEARATFTADAPAPLTFVLPPPPVRRGRTNDLTRPHRAFWIVALAVLILYLTYFSLTIGATLSEHLDRAAPSANLTTS